MVNPSFTLPSIILSVINQTLKMDDSTPTQFLPGFTMSSRKYKVMYMTSTHFAFGSYVNVLNWIFMELMDLILDFLKYDDVNFENIQSELEDSLREEGFYGLPTEQTTVNIFEEPFFPRPKGHMRRIKITFLDQHNTIVEFSLAKNNTIKTLKDLALNAVISNVPGYLAINNMEIPETLKMTLKKEFYNEWSRLRFPSYNITLLPFAESLKAGGIDARTLDLIMSAYMFRIEITLQQLDHGFPDPNNPHMVRTIFCGFVWIWRPFFQWIASLGSPGLMDHLNHTIHELWGSSGVLGQLAIMSV